MIVFTSSFICKVKHEEYNLSCQTLKLSFTIHKIDVSIRKKQLTTFLTYCCSVVSFLRYLVGEVCFILLKTRMNDCELLNPDFSAISTMLSSELLSSLQAYSMRSLFT